MSSRVLICGCRYYTNRNIIRKFLNTLSLNTIIITGGCKGADIIAEKEALSLGMEVWSYPAQWKEYGRKAPFICNSYMLEDGKPDYVVFFHPNIGSSKGTKDMINKALKCGIRVCNGETLKWI